MTELEKSIYEAVSLIPKGKVSTYASIAERIGNRKLARAVGNALHKNPNNNIIPCHRVVNSKGKLSENYAFGGLMAQRKKLLSEGVCVIDNKVDIDLYLW